MCRNRHIFAPKFFCKSLSATRQMVGDIGTDKTPPAALPIEGKDFLNRCDSDFYQSTYSDVQTIYMCVYVVCVFSLCISVLRNTKYTFEIEKEGMLRQ